MLNKILHHIDERTFYMAFGTVTLLEFICRSIGSHMAQFAIEKYARECIMIDRKKMCDTLQRTTISPFARY